MPFSPGDPWPTSTPGGVAHPRWGGYVKLWVLAEIAPGTPMHVGPMSDGSDMLDAGNVVGDAGVIAGGGPTTDPDGGLPTTTGLWVDLTCDITTLETRGGAQTTAGILSKVDAGTAQFDLWDPTGKYDPQNPESPFTLGTRSRLVAGRRVKIFVEIIDDPAAGTVTAHHLDVFTGTVDDWSEKWTKEPGERFATVTCSDLVKDLNRLNRDEQPAIGAGDTVVTRLNRICTYFGVTGPALFGTLSTRTLAATTLAQSAWELLNRTVDDDLGFLFVTGAGRLAFFSDDSWTFLGSESPIDLTVGECGTAWDIVADATPSSKNKDQINAVTAARTGGVSQIVQADASVGEFGEISYKRTDLGLASDPQVGGWAERLVSIAAYPRYTIDDVTMIPAVSSTSWEVFDKLIIFNPVSSIVEVKIDTPRFGYQLDVLARMVGWTHTITADQWSVTWRTVSANMASGADTFTVGPSPYSRLDAGNVVG